MPNVNSAPSRVQEIEIMPLNYPRRERGGNRLLLLEYQLSGYQSMDVAGSIQALAYINSSNLLKGKRIKCFFALQDKKVAPQPAIFIHLYFFLSVSLSFSLFLSLTLSHTLTLTLTLTIILQDLTSAMPSTSLKTTLDSNNDDSTTNAANTNTINTAYGPSTLDINCPPGQEELGKSINRSITPNHEPRVFFFDIDNCLYSKHCGIAELMRAKIEQYFRDVGFESDHVQTISYRYYIDYGLAIRGLVLHHPEIDIKDYDDKVDGALPLQDILKENIPLRNMIKSLNIEKKWLFTNAGKNHALRVIKILGLEGCFDGLTYCDYLKPDFNCKPEPEAFYRAMKDAGVVHPSNCYLVDDSAANVDKALDIGWTAVHVADDPEVSQFGHFQIGDILELPKALPEFWSKEDAAAALSAVNAVASEKAPGTGKARLSA
ncbi:HAD-like domain-containing protein [Lobosporangium transversale]|uniref:HAD-like domain-containing protein n=1 Tax=Lobosporangium transversale TaxID=64571 RepID=A0A1Y2GY94_9FUNG|nr:HAD-like domain-containing protein [Lobosporangium transversale]ORZ23743.1 HAD-like domain-containing protein [Lobosporangium transversale]|eukprot:XP_021883557.1 HAD-like domain-containing protein [Lobosporangium transversale]